MNTIALNHSTPEIGRTPIDYRIVLRELPARGSDAPSFFRAEQDVVAESGAFLWTEGAELVVSHADARVTRHRGLWCLDNGWGR